MAHSFNHTWALPLPSQVVSANAALFSFLSLSFFKGAYHEIHNEPNWWKQDVDDIIQFMKDRIAKTEAKL